MIQSANKKTSEYLLIFGVPAVSIFVLTSTVTDPVNLPKLLLASGLGWASLFLVFRDKWRYLWIESRYLSLSALFFTLALLNSVLNRSGPIEQTIYGTYARNTGLLAYIAMLGVMLLAASVTSHQTFRRFNTALLFTGAANTVYCGWVLIFGDFIPWSNQYGAILGFLGNPNFISAFLGMFISVAAAQIIDSNLSLKIRILLVALSAIAFFEIIKSFSIQGVIVTFGGIAVVIFYKIRSVFNNLITFAYLSCILIVGFLAVLGMLQQGPLKFIYKRTVSLRGSYWDAGIGMGNEKPFTGVGLDSYIDWYRRARPPVALVDLPGAHITSNAAHNVIIDFFANGGFPLLVTYIAIIAVCVFAIVRTTRQSKVYDSTFVGLVVGWLAFQAQSIISINQIGLMIWGWAFSGLLVAYTVIKKKQLNESDQKLKAEKKSKRLSQSNLVISDSLIVFLGLCVGLFLVSPAYVSDSRWRVAIESRDLIKVENSLSPSFMNPSSSYKYNQAIDLMARSGLNEQAHKYALIAVQYNPSSFDSWKLLYYIPNSTELERARALENMKRLDPLNKDVTK